VMLDRPCY